MRLRRIVTFAAQAGLLSLVLVGAAGAADPSFAPGGGLAVGRNPVSFEVADVNGDGKPDLAVANQGSDDLTVLLGDGTGGFSEASGSPVPLGDGPVAVATADLNGDGKADLGVADSSSNLTVLLGDGTGGFGAAPSSPVSLGGSPEDIAAADLNGDGNVDFALPVQQNGWRAAVLLGDGTGRFAAAPGSPVAVGGRSGAAAIAIADLNSDRKRDLVVARTESRLLSILLGDGAGRFAAAGTVAAGYGPSSLAVADLNRDGKPDLAVGSLYSDGGRAQTKLTIMLGNGAGGSRRAAGSPMAVPGMPLSVAVADVNADGRLDLAVATSYADADGITVLIGNGTGRFRPAVDSPFAVPSPNQVEVADLNGDGKSDFAVASPQGFRVMFRTPSTPAIVQGRRLRGRPNAVFSTRGLITKLAADGNRVAVKMTVQSSRSCGKVIVWTAGRRSKSFSTSNPGCGSILCKRASGCVDELALGDGQVAWVSRSGGNTLELMVITARLSRGAPRMIEHAVNGFGAGGDPEGFWVGQLLGGGSLLAYNGWRVVCDSPDENACDEGKATLGVTNERIVRISDGRRVVVKRGNGSRPLSAVGGGRMAVEADGAITILAANGTRVSAIPALPANPPRAIALSRTRLAVLRTFTLDVYNPATGTAAKSVPLGPAAALQLAGVNSTVALFRGPRRVVLVRLRDGKPISLPLPAGRAANIVEARLTEAGLFYAYNVRRPSPRGRIVFEPAARLLARF